MKRIASLFLAFVMVCMVCAVSVPVYAGDFDKAVGVWKLEEMSGDNTMSKEDLKEYERLGVAMYLKLRKDGTCKFSLYGDTMEGTWSEYGLFWIMPGSPIFWTAINWSWTDRKSVV